MSLPTATGAVVETNAVDARAAAIFVADQLGDECRPVLEALGLIGYVGGDRTNPSGTHAGRCLRVWRQGAVTQ